MLHCLREDGCHWAIYIHTIQLLLKSHLFLKHEMLISALTSMAQMQQYFSAIVSKGLAHSMLKGSLYNSNCLGRGSNPIASALQVDGSNQRPPRFTRKS